MNKIITINLGGIAIQIEEDAYDVMRDYLKSLEIHFKGTENADEILSDIENRIAEMLYERLKAGKVSINTTDVNEVAAAMGNPREFGSEEASTEEPEPTIEPTRKIKRLFRDSENRKVAGVASGIAKYLDIDVTLVRIIWLVMLLIFGTGLLVYVLLWAILPEAKTAAERLEMMGEVPNVENIKNTIRDEASSAYKNIKATAQSTGFQNFFDKVLVFCIAIIRAFAKFFGVLIIIAVLIALFSFFISFFANGHWFNWGSGFKLNVNDFDASLIGSGPYWLVKICGFLAITIPLLYILVRILISMIDAPRPNKLVKQGVVSVWLMTILVGIGGIIYGVNQFKAEASVTKRTELALTSDTLNITVSDFLTDDMVEYDRRVRLDVVQTTEDKVFVQVTKKARGRNERNAEVGIESLIQSMRMTGNTMLIHEKILTKSDPKAKMPYLKYTLHIPEGTYVIFNLNTERIIYHVDNRQDIYDRDMAGKTFFMTSTGLSCVDCEGEYKDDQSHSSSLDYIEHIDINDAIRVLIIEDGTNRVVYPKDKKWRESLEVELKSNILEIRRNDNFGALLDWFSADENLKVEVHTSGLESIEADGASSVRYKADNSLLKEYFSIEVNGANSIEISDLNAAKTSVDIAGTNKITLSGKTNIFLLESDGASSIQARNFIAENINVDINGAAICKINAIQEITGKVDGASSLTYVGSPDVSVKSRGMSIVKPED
jgi:phage shock protein PspC (stress-responsive transcriptional regulator)